jgi:hypothetical protein
MIDPNNPSLPPVRNQFGEVVNVSNLHFHNTYDNTTIPSQLLTKVQEAAMVAELNLEEAFPLRTGAGPDQTGHPVQLNVNFDFQDQGTGVVASNDASGEFMQYDQLKIALTAAANQLSDNPYGAAAVAAQSLPPTDPSNGANFWISAGQAQILDPNYTHPSSVYKWGPIEFRHYPPDVTVHINSEIANSYSVDAIAAGIEHEITEGGMGRIGSLGTKDGGAWTLMDLFQYNLNGSHDYSVKGGGYFSLDGKQMLNQFAPVTTVNTPSGPRSTDLADFAGSNDVFGTNDGGGEPSLSDADMKVMSALGWSNSWLSIPLNSQWSVGGSYAGAHQWNLRELIVADDGTVPDGRTVHLPTSPGQLHHHPGETVPFLTDLPASSGQPHLHSGIVVSPFLTDLPASSSQIHPHPGIVETVPFKQEDIPHSNPLSFNPNSDILHHTEATLPISNIVHHTGEAVPFSDIANLDGGTLPNSSTLHSEATVPTSNIEHSGLSQSFWAEAAGSSGLGALAGRAVHPIMDLANNAHTGVGLASHIPDQINSPATQFAANHFDAVQHVEVAQLVHPVDSGPVYPSIDVAHHVADFAHQIHI